VLAVAPEFSENARDDSLEATIPEDIEVHRVRAVPVAFTRRMRIGNLALRSYPFLRARGSELLSSGSFDLIFFSTSLFPILSLGPVWRKRFGIPYVLDFQDPWLTDYYNESALTPPGGKLKYALSNVLARALEPRVVSEAAHIVVVSPAYPDLLRARYPELNGKGFTVLPFAASETDFDLARASKINHDVFVPNDGLIHWVYAGVVGAIMEKSLRAFFLALQSRLRSEPQLRNRLKIHFVGTDYAEAARARKSVEPIAAEFGLEGMVEERTNRLPFLTTLKLLSDADALLIFGSDDPSYTASKLFPYILARKPLLVIAHEKSSMCDIVRRTRAGILVTFNGEESVAEFAGRIESQWLENQPATAAIDWKEFERYTARSMTASLCSVFNNAIFRPSEMMAQRLAGSVGCFVKQEKR
jgi:glycosyltransferase involved in cell wall biosynthesis